MTDAFPALDHEQLAVLGREFLMAGHLIDRASMPHIIGRFGREVMAEIAIDEWMGASPVYTRRMQALLDFAGDDVATIFKGMQFDIGAPHQFLDFRYRVTDADHGEFWLDHCGALMDVEPMGDDYVTTMCHDIEDPTFDATACATNRRAQVRPLHRPPRVPADREPHCHWEVTIVHDADPLPEPPAAELLAETRAATLPLPPLPAGDDDPTTHRRHDYRGPLDPDLQLEDFSDAVLRAVLDETALQGHLLVLSGLVAVLERSDEATAERIGRAQFTGVAGVVASRLARALELPADRDGLARLLDLHPAFHPRSYVDVRIERGAGEDDLSVHLLPCAALEERSGINWPALLAAGEDGPLDAIAAALDPTACFVRRPVPGEGAVVSWDLVLGSDPREVPVEVQLTRFSTGAEFTFA